jgi:tol-pal system protein YbgF
MKFPIAGFAGTMCLISGMLVGEPVPAFPADKDIVQVQRDVAFLGDQVKMMQETVNSLLEKLAGQGALTQQTLDRVNQIIMDNAVAMKNVTDQLAQQEQKLVTPLASMNSKLDQVVTQVGTTQDNLSDLNSRIGRLEQRIVDLENAVKVMQAPPVPPPTQGGPPPGVTAQGLFQSASGDQLSGKSDLALQEYRDYLKYFGDTDTAAAAQFHIGEILLSQGNADDAIQAFDTVVDQFPKSSKAPDALYLKAQALQKQGKRAQATQVLNKLIRQYPDSDAAQNAKSELPRPARRPGQK